MPVEILKTIRDAKGDIPQVLVFDIETTPILAYVWGCYKEFVLPSQIIKESEVLCFAAKWLGEDSVFFDSRKGEKNDKRLCKVVWSLIDKADVLIAHNSRAFDCATMNTRFAKWGMGEPSPYKVVDTLAIAKKRFRFPRNQLDAIARYLDVGRKVEHEGFDLWKKCMAGDKGAWQRMQEYNIQDVVILEDVYMKIRSFDRTHPNIGLMYGDGVVRCVCCGSTKLKAIANKSVYTGVSAYPAMMCTDCKKVMRKRHRVSQKGWGDDHVTNAQ